MKLPINKKMMMFGGIGVIVLIGGGMVGMRFMKKAKPPPEQAVQETNQEGEQTGEADAKLAGSATARLVQSKGEKEKYVSTRLPSVYKERAITIFKPLTLEEVARMLQEVEKEKGEYEKKRAQLEFKESTLESMRADLETERRALDVIKQDLNKILDFITAQKVELKNESIQVDETELKNIKKLAVVYADMKPEKAALIIKEMDEETAVKLLSMMDGKSSAKILESFDPVHAVKLSAKLKILKSDFKKDAR
jgi:flagellar motility protein MotE (MotC chaperone)